MILLSPCNSYPGSQEKVTESPGSRPSPLRLPFMGIPGSLHAVASEPEGMHEQTNTGMYVYEQYEEP